MTLNIWRSPYFEWNVENLTSTTKQVKEIAFKAFDDADVTLTMECIIASDDKPDTAHFTYRVEWINRSDLDSLADCTIKIASIRLNGVLHPSKKKEAYINAVEGEAMKIKIQLLFGRRFPMASEDPMSMSEFAAKFLNDTSLADVDVVCGSKVFRAHKVILAGRSDVFHRMLTGPFKEARENKIEIKTFEPRVVEIMLKFIYEDDIDEKDVSWEVFEAAKMYDLGRLAELCLTSLRSSINVSNCCRMLEAAHMYDLLGVFELALVFAQNNKRRIVRTKGWRDIKKNKDLMAKIVPRLM